MAVTSNYYRLLNLESKQEAILSAAEVKQAYRRALLLYHPDKVTIEPGKSDVTVDDIALAYKTLADPTLRAEYDDWLRTVVEAGSLTSSTPRPRHTGLETVDLDDLDYDEPTGKWSRGCRCGDEKGFMVSQLELEQQANEGEIIVGCKGCSLWLRILFGEEE
ncbi:hypothetical protein LTR09_005788 [Extremus antarcticus]|uniref:Diphthamide biosynthesis protein 4 n=1 Tax=Extremus antarcticus TaxID=702011 RepID=A0AAJ0G8E7_9PEZI|nr:hypothetical protein LTR09_005788 [Extremus antarcticus]